MKKDKQLDSNNSDAAVDRHGVVFCALGKMCMPKLCALSFSIRPSSL